MGTDLVHVLAMLIWGLGAPLLVWHRFPRLSRAYMHFAIAFVVVTVTSHELLGECVLTTLAREMWVASGGFRERTPFTVLLANAVSGIRPSERAAVLAWELVVLSISAASLWCWYRTRPSTPPRRNVWGGPRGTDGGSQPNRP